MTARDAAAGLLLSVALVGGNAVYVAHRMDGFVHKPHRVLETDHLRYIEMARGPAGDAELAGEAPFCWRVLVPALARALTRAGLGLNPAFYLLTNLALVGFLFALWVHLAARGFSPAERALGLALAGLLQGAVRWYEYQYWMTDPLALFLVALGLHLARTARPVALAGVALAAALARENAVLLLPYFFICEARRTSTPRALARTALVAAAPLGALLALRALVAPSHPYEPWAAVADVVAFRLRHLADNQAYVLTVGTWGALVPLALLCPGRLAGLLRRHPEDAALVALVYATLAVSNNTERPLMYALPAVLPAALGSLRRFVEEARLPRGAVFAVVLALQALHYAETVFADVPAASVYQPASLAVVAAMAGAWVAGRAALRRGRLASA